MTDVAIPSAARPLTGAYGKSLKDVPQTEPAAIAAREAPDRAGDARVRIDGGQGIAPRPEAA